MNIRRLILDVDMARKRPTVIEVAKELSKLPEIEVVNITVDGIDLETVGTEILIEGVDLDYDKIIQLIERTGAVVHSIDQIVVGSRMIEYIPRVRGR